MRGSLRYLLLGLAVAAATPWLPSRAQRAEPISSSWLSRFTWASARGVLQAQQADEPPVEGNGRGNSGSIPDEGLPENLPMCGDSGPPFGCQPGSNCSATCIDWNNTQCDMCGTPLPGRGYDSRILNYRHDCGARRADPNDVPLHTYTRRLTRTPGVAGPNPMWTNGFCELNLQKSCADGIANRDWLFQAKSLNLTRGFTFDFTYCRHNGWMRARVRDAVRRGFEYLDEAATAECEELNKEFPILNLSLSQFGPYNHDAKEEDDATHVGMNRTVARMTAAWMCAMGGANGKLNGAACDMAYCAYTFGDLQDDAKLMPGVPEATTNGSQMCMYEDCVGWRPEYGMPGTY